MNRCVRKSSNLRVLICAVVAVAVVVGGGTAYAQTPLPAFGNIGTVNNNASTDVGDDVMPRVASDGGGNLVVVTEFDDPAGGPGSDLDIGVMASADGGGTWSDVAALNTDAATDVLDDVEPEIATDGNGMWVVTWQVVGGGGDTTTEIRWSASTDNGATWTDPTALTHAAENANAAAVDARPHVATDGAGTWIIVWDSGRDIDSEPDVTTDADIFYAISTDNAANFGPASALNTDHVTDNAQNMAPTIATDAAGNWMVVWETTGQLSFARSINNGLIWSPPAPVPGAAGTNPTLINDRAREATTTTAWYAIWEAGGIFVSRYLEADDPEATPPPEGADFDEWLAPVTIAASGSNPSIANDAIGRLIATWVDGDVFAALSVNIGQDWSAVAAVDPEGDAAGMDPQAAPTGPDNWMILWSSTKERDETGPDADLFAVPFTFGVFIDCNENGVHDANDIASGTSEDCNNDTVPDDCRDLQPDTDGDGTIDACEEDDNVNGNDNVSDNENENANENGNDNSGGLPIGGGAAGCGGGASAAPCGMGMIGALSVVLFGLGWMKLGVSRRRRHRR